MSIHTMKFEENDNCPIYRNIVNSRVTVHGRKASEKNRAVKIGDTILLQIFKDLQNIAVVEVQVTDIKEYADVDEFVKAEKLDKILGDPTKCMNMKDEKDYVKYYSNFVDQDEIRDLKSKYGFGFIGFHIRFIHEYQIFRRTVQEPWFSYIKKGDKTVEGRLDKTWVSDLQILDRIIWSKSEDGIDHFSTYVTDLIRYPSFEKMLEDEGIEHVLPGVSTIEDGVKVYRKFYSKQDEDKYGVIAIRLKLF